MTRREERQRVIQLLYQLNITGDEVLPARDKLGLSPFQLKLIDCFVSNRPAIDAIITKNLKKWSINTIGKVDLACLQLAVTEVQYIDDIPSRVSLNEAIEMAKLFGDDETPKFVNGVLRAISDDLGL